MELILNGNMQKNILVEHGKLVLTNAIPDQLLLSMQLPVALA